MEVEYLPTVGADQAKAWLALNTQNRRMSFIRVNQLKNAMLRGEWRESTDAIGVEGDLTRGVLFNGQHRLQAHVLADEEQPGITLPYLLAWGFGPDTGLITDTNKSRSLEDTLFFLGEDEHKPRNLSALVTLAWHIERGTYVSRQPTPTRMQQVDWLKNTPDLRDAVQPGVMMSRGAHIPASGLMAAVWLIGRGNHVERLDGFVSEVAHGEGLTADDMTYQLRDLFTGWSINRNTDRGRPWKVCAMTIYTWNAWLKRERKNLNVTRLKSIPEAL